MFHVSCWWESKILLSVRSLTSCALVCGLFSSPLCPLTAGAASGRGRGQEELRLCHSGLSFLPSSWIEGEPVLPWVLCHICQSPIDICVVSEVMLGT